MTDSSTTPSLTSSLTLPLTPAQDAWLKSTIVDVPDYPKPGILFKDITTLLQDGKALKFVIDVLTAKARELKVDVIAALELRGCLFGSPVASALGIGFVPVRKRNKLPREVVQMEYALEYGTDVIEIHADAIKPGQRVMLIDDLLATGGTAGAAQKLIAKLIAAQDPKSKAELVATAFVIELAFLEGRKQLVSGPHTFSILTY